MSNRENVNLPVWMLNEDRTEVLGLLGPDGKTILEGGAGDGGGNVTSVAGREGDITLTTADIGGLAAATSAAIAANPPVTTVPEYTVGVFYFPGWSPDQTPWTVIPENRVPLLGRFDDTAQANCDKQLKMMTEHAINLVAYDFYGHVTSGAYVAHEDYAINNHRTSTVPNKPKFCVAFALGAFLNELTPSNWHLIYNVWIANYFNDANYYKDPDDGKPVVFILFQDDFLTMCGGDAAVAKAQLNAARAAAVAAGFPGIHFVAGQSSSSPYWIDQASSANMDFDSATTYGTFTQVAISDDSLSPLASSFAEMDKFLFGPPDDGYRCWWGNAGYQLPESDPPEDLNPNGWAGTSDDPPYLFVPISAGWNSIPWGGSQTITAAISTDGIMTVTAVGTANLGERTALEASGVPARCQISGPQFDGTPGGAGTYPVSPAPAVAVTSKSITVEVINAMPDAGTNEFRNHLYKALHAGLAYKARTKCRWMISAWNELGEGHFIIPTEGIGYSRLRDIKEVFGK